MPTIAELDSFRRDISVKPLQWLKDELPLLVEEWQKNLVLDEIGMRITCPICGSELIRQTNINGEDLVAFGLVVFQCDGCKRLFEEDRYGKHRIVDRMRILEKVEKTKRLEAVAIEEKMLLEPLLQITCIDCKAKFSLSRDLISVLEDTLNRKYSSGQIDMFWNMCERCQKKLFGTSIAHLIRLAVVQGAISSSDARRFGFE